MIKDNKIRSWLDGDRDYQEGVQLLKTILKNSPLVRKLEKAKRPSRHFTKLLEDNLVRLAVQREKPKAQSIVFREDELEVLERKIKPLNVPTPQSIVKKGTKTEEIEILEVENSRLYGIRQRAANRLQDPKGDAGRIRANAAIVEKCLRTHNKILDNRDRIRGLRSGRISSIIDDKPDPVFIKFRTGRKGVKLNYTKEEIEALNLDALKNLERRVRNNFEVSKSLLRKEKKKTDPDPDSVLKLEAGVKTRSEQLLFIKATYGQKQRRNDRA